MMYFMYMDALLKIVVVLCAILTVIIVTYDMYFSFSRKSKLVKDYFNTLDKDTIIQKCIDVTFPEDFVDVNSYINGVLKEMYSMIYKKMIKDGINIKYKYVENTLDREMDKFKNRFMINKISRHYDEAKGIKW